ncbi:MAG: S-adenosylmethionine:tRNA ribosyltransferase-isomerase [Omnitrophica WOR_2 bacterium SM23_72]|nr:MAG: S-adenosylmethionine:tRNA ribosyltransferase-isomerase [Omnitrophica WOR_2 bacterium SM23_72]
MELSKFDYSLPKELIAQYPLKKRDTARLLVLNRKKDTIEHRGFKEILEFLHKDDLLVLNNTKVLPARLEGLRSTRGKVEVLLIEGLATNRFKAFIKPSRVKAGERIIFDSGRVFGMVCGKDEIAFNIHDSKRIYELGVMPLPPYIKRKPEESDRISYQTVYAKVPGAIASPTAGLHFTKELIGKIKSQGVNVTYLTLHVGVGTFRPVKVQDITQHQMEREYFKIPVSTLRQIKRARSCQSHIMAVGTTSLRALETYASGRQKGYTDLFIYPGYRFKLVDSLLTNFHLPRTTLFMLVCAFAGEKLIKKAYQEAIDKKYRFYSYGDAMLII